MSLEGRVSILDFVNGGGHERIYALVGSDGSATRVKFAANATVRQGMSLVVSGYASHRTLVVQQQQPGPRKAAAAAATKVSMEGTLEASARRQFRWRNEPLLLDAGGRQRRRRRARHRDRADRHEAGHARRGHRHAHGRDNHAGFDHRACGSARAQYGCDNVRADGLGARHPAQLPADATRRGTVDAVHAGRGGWRSCSPAPAASPPTGTKSRSATS